MVSDTSQGGRAKRSTSGQKKVTRMQTVRAKRKHKKKEEKKKKKKESNSAGVLDSDEERRPRACCNSLHGEIQLDQDAPQAPHLLSEL